MTREDSILKFNSVVDSCYEDVKQFTIDFFDTDVTDICNEDYVCSEEEDLGALVYRCENILEIMRNDITDGYAITRIKYCAEQRLKTIKDERD